MADFRFRVGADYSEFLASSRGVISGLRGELRSLQQQATLHIREQGNVAGVSGQIAGFQGRGQALLDEALRRGVISQSAYNEELAKLGNTLAELRQRLVAQAAGQGLRGRIPDLDPARVSTARAGLTGVFDAERERSAQGERAVASAAERAAQQRIRDAEADTQMRAAARAQLQEQLRAEIAAEGISVTEARQRRHEVVFGSKAPDVAQREADEAAASATRAASAQRLAEFRRVGGADPAARRRLVEEGETAARQQRVNALIAQEAEAEREKLAAARISIAAARENATLQAQVNNARRELISQVRREELAQRGITGQGSVFQRLQAFIANRPGAGKDERLAGEFQTFGQFFTSKALTTGGFALSGAVLYGTVQAFRETIREASSLQRELAIVKSQFDDVGAAAGQLGQSGFEDFAQQVVEVSVDTGVAADEVTRVSRQLAGVFKTPTGLPDFNRALNETHEALKLSQVTGLPYQEITDSLTAITSTFGTSFTTIGDLAVGLEQRFGVLAPEIIKFTADLAPVAKELGFTVDQIASLGAIAQQRSGISGGALAESFNRALPTIQGQQVKLAELLGQRPSTAAFVDPVLKDLSAGKGAAVIADLTRAFGEMTKGQRNALAELLGGQRNAKAFFAVLQGGKDTIDALNNSNPDQFAGKLNERFKDFQSTVEFAFQRAQRALEEFGLALFNSGIADGLKLIADNGALAAQFASVFLNLVSALNNGLGGIPVKLLAVYASLKLLSSLRNNVQLGGIFGALRGGGRGGGLGDDNPLAGGAIPEAGAAGVERARFSPRFTGAVGSFVNGNATGGRIRTALSSLTADLALAVGALAVGQLVQTVGTVTDELKKANTDLVGKVQEALDSGVSQAEIIKRARESGGFDNATGSIVGDIALKILTFGQADTTSPGDSVVDVIQELNAKRRKDDLDAVLAAADEADRKQLAQFVVNTQAPDALPSPDLDAALGALADKGGLEDVVRQLLSDSKNDDFVAQLDKIIAFARDHGSKAVVEALEKVSLDYRTAVNDAKTVKDASDFLATLEDVRARYEAGDASLSEILDAERHEIAALKHSLDIVTDPTVKAQFARQLATEQKNLDQIITSAAAKIADLHIRLAGYQGGDVGAATAQARLEQLRTVVAQGASPSSQLDAALAALDAQNQLLTTAINAPTVVNGIARAPSTAEKLARAAKGIQITPELRTAVIRASLLVTAGGDIANIARLAGVDQERVIQSIIDVLTLSDHTAIDVLKIQIESKIKNFRIELANLDSFDKATRDGVYASLAALQQARTALDHLPTQATDPGLELHQDTTELKNQQAIEASDEARAYSDALIAVQRAQAHGDPVGVAQAQIASAQLALRYAQSGGKPSEVAAAQAQLIDAQNQLEDANNAIVQARLQFAIAAAEGNPVEQARLRLEALRIAAQSLHGEAEQLQNAAAQVDADRTLHDAVQAVLHAQINLVRAIAEAAGDTVKAAEVGLYDAQVTLNDLLATGADPEGAAVKNATAAAVAAQATVRDQKLATQERDIDFALQMERITTQQAIAQFQALLQIPNLTAEQTQDILLKIKQLQGELSRDLQFDIPSEIDLDGIFYQARRINQAQAGGLSTPAGPGAFYDNRQLNFGPFIISKEVDADGVVGQILDSVGAPPRNGERIGVY